MKLLRQEDGYSYYENPDKELVVKIQEFPKPIILTDWFTFNNHLEWKLIEVKENGKYLMESSEGDLKTLSLEDYNDLVNQIHLININSTFLVSDTFNKFIAPHKYSSSIITAMTDKYLVNPYRNETFYCGVNSIFVGEEWGANVWDTKYYNGTKRMSVNFTLRSSNGNGHMYFTENGEIANRDYNQDFNLTKEFISKEESVQEFLEQLDIKIPNKIEQGGGRYFIDGYGIDFFFSDEDSYSNEKFSVQFTPEQSSGVYYIQGESSYTKFKKPKKGVVEIEREVFFNEVTKILNNLIKEKL